MVSKKTIENILTHILNKKVSSNEKCQPDYITSLPYARATTVEEVDLRLDAIENLIGEEQKKIDENTKKLEEYDKELTELWDENKKLESQIDELDEKIKSNNEGFEDSFEGYKDKLDDLKDTIRYSDIPIDFQEELTDALNNVFNTPFPQLTEEQVDTVLRLVETIDNYADDIRPIVADYMTNIDVAIADNIIEATSDVEDLMYSVNTLVGARDSLVDDEIELGELVELRGLNETREADITIQQNKLYADNDKSEVRISKLSEEADKQEKKKQKLKKGEE